MVGEERCPIVDTWWQTETGGIMISPLPGATALKPGCATRPFFGVELGLMDESGQLIEDQEASGNLVITDSTLQDNPSDGFGTPGFPGIFYLGSGPPIVTNSVIS